MAGTMEERARGAGSLLDLCGVLDPRAAEELAKAIGQNRRMRSRARRVDA